MGAQQQERQQPIRQVRKNYSSMLLKVLIGVTIMAMIVSGVMANGANNVQNTQRSTNSNKNNKARSSTDTVVSSNKNNRFMANSNIKQPQIIYLSNLSQLSSQNGQQQHRQQSNNHNRPVSKPQQNEKSNNKPSIHILPIMVPPGMGMGSPMPGMMNNMGGMMYNMGGMMMMNPMIGSYNPTMGSYNSIVNNYGGSNIYNPINQIYAHPPPPIIITSPYVNTPIQTTTNIKLPPKYIHRTVRVTVPAMGGSRRLVVNRQVLQSTINQQQQQQQQSFINRQQQTTQHSSYESDSDYISSPTYGNSLPAYQAGNEFDYSGSGFNALYAGMGLSDKLNPLTNKDTTITNSETDFNNNQLTNSLSLAMSPLISGLSLIYSSTVAAIRSITTGDIAIPNEVSTKPTVSNVYLIDVTETSIGEMIISTDDDWNNEQNSNTDKCKTVVDGFKIRLRNDATKPSNLDSNNKQPQKPILIGAALRIAECCQQCSTSNPITTTPITSTSITTQKLRSSIYGQKQSISDKLIATGSHQVYKVSTVQDQQKTKGTRNDYKGAPTVTLNPHHDIDETNQSDQSQLESVRGHRKQQPKIVIQINTSQNQPQINLRGDHMSNGITGPSVTMSNNIQFHGNNNQIEVQNNAISHGIGSNGNKMNGGHMGENYYPVTIPNYQPVTPVKPMGPTQPKQPLITGKTTIITPKNPISPSFSSFSSSSFSSSSPSSSSQSSQSSQPSSKIPTSFPKILQQQYKSEDQSGQIIPPDSSKLILRSSLASKQQNPSTQTQQSSNLRTQDGIVEEQEQFESDVVEDENEIPSQDDDGSGDLEQVQDEQDQQGDSNPEDPQQ